MTEKLKVLKEFEWEKTGSWRRGDPYEIVFCYPLKSDSYILKGSGESIEKYLKSIEHKEPIFAMKSLWHKGKSRDINHFYGVEAYWGHAYKEVPRKIPKDMIDRGLTSLYEGMTNLRYTHYELRFRVKKSKENPLGVILKTSRIPRCFPKEFKKILEGV
jgi:hypothetical protein